MSLYSAKIKLSYFINLFFLLFLFSNQVSIAQVTQQWFKAYNHSHNTTSIGYKIKTDKQDNVYLLGTSTNAPGLEPLICLIKFNTNGITQWIARYNHGFNGYNFPWGMELDSFGNIYIVGTSQRDSLSSNNRDIILLKYSPSGNLLIEKRYFFTENNRATGVSIELDSSQNIYIAGSVWMPNIGFFGTSYCVTIKCDPLGNLLWYDKYAGIDSVTDCSGDFIGLDHDNNIYTGGNIFNDSTSDYLGYYIQKLTENGKPIWRKPKYYYGNSYPNAMQVSSTGHVYLGGAITHSSVSSLDMGILKYDSSGSLCWTKIIENSSEESYDYILDIKTDKTENVYFTGRDFIPGNYLDIATGKVDSTGKTVWLNHFDPEMGNDDTGFSLALDDSNNVYVTGKSGFGEGSNIITLRINSEGQFTWHKIFSSASPYSSDEGHSIALDTQKNILVGGFSYTTPSTADMIAIKYSQTTDINNTTTSLGDNFVLNQNFPNPFNPSTKFEFKISEFGQYEIRIFDINGKLIEVLINRILIKGIYAVEWNASKASSGIYFYGLYREGKKLDMKKMIYLK